MGWLSRSRVVSHLFLLTLWEFQVWIQAFTPSGVDCCLQHYLYFQIIQSPCRAIRGSFTSLDQFVHWNAAVYQFPLSPSFSRIFPFDACSWFLLTAPGSPFFCLFIDWLTHPFFRYYSESHLWSRARTKTMKSNLPFCIEGTGIHVISALLSTIQTCPWLAEAVLFIM